MWANQVDAATPEPSTHRIAVSGLIVDPATQFVALSGFGAASAWGLMYYLDASPFGPRHDPYALLDFGLMLMFWFLALPFSITFVGLLAVVMLRAAIRRWGRGESSAVMPD
jgi:hypothetical protein